MSNTDHQVGSVDRVLQDEELQVLACVFPEEFSVIDSIERMYKLLVRTDDSEFGSVVLQFTLVKGYPSERGPDFDISAPNIPKDKYQELCNTLREVCSASGGSPVIYSMIEVIRSFLSELSAYKHVSSLGTTEPVVVVTTQSPPTNTFYRVPSVRDHLIAAGKRFPLADGVPCPLIYHGEPITDRKSVFQAHCCRVSSLPEVSAFISTMLADRKVSVATHNITAWYLQAKLKPDAPNTSLVADFDDDGETHAGGRLLHLVSLSAVEGVAVMVSRWYGGIQLGPDRFKHINNAASQLLMQTKLTRGTANGDGNESTAANNTGKSKKNRKKR